VLDMRAYAALATAHRPTDPAALKVEAQRLARTGLQARDLSRLLGVDFVQITEWLAQPLAARGSAP
jgi:hypothetical protein